VDELGVAARRGVRRDERLPAGRGEVRLLRELPPRRRHRILADDVEQPRRQLPVALPDRVPVLLDQQHPPVLVHRDDGDRAGVIDVLPHHLAVAVADAILANAPHGAPVDLAAVEHLGLERLVGQRVP
jgi:hypothetical protein